MDWEQSNVSLKKWVHRASEAAGLNRQSHRRDARKSVEHFRAFREANLDLLKSLTPEQWKHHGMHSARGREAIEHIVRIYAGHDLNHLQQIERILSAKGK